MITQLYNDFAHYYEAICEDRDFTAQMDLVLNNLEPAADRRSLLELFAGPAYHGIAAQQLADIDVWAVDASAEMRSIAGKRGFRDLDQYVVGNLPAAVNQIPEEVSFNCVLCLRYSLGYLDRRQVYELLRILAARLKPKGRIYIEAHDISFIVANMQGTSIHCRFAETDDGQKLRCTWPSGDIAWKPTDFQADMTVLVEVGEEDKRQEFKFSSVENIYSCNEIVFIASLIGLKSRIVQEDPARRNLWESIFANSIIIELTNEETCL
jgi:SAM-dependent methyltransferase